MPIFKSKEELIKKALNRVEREKVNGKMKSESRKTGKKKTTKKETDFIKKVRKIMEQYNFNKREIEEIVKLAEQIPSKKRGVFMASIERTLKAIGRDKKILKNIFEEIKRKGNLEPLLNRWDEISYGEIHDIRRSVDSDLSKKAVNHTFSPTAEGIYNYIRLGRNRADLVGFDEPKIFDTTEAKRYIEQALLENGFSKQKAKTLAKKVVDVEKMKKYEPYIIADKTSLAYIDALEDVLRKEKLSRKQIYNITRAAHNLFIKENLEEINKRASETEVKKIEPVDKLIAKHLLGVIKRKRKTREL